MDELVCFCPASSYSSPSPVFSSSAAGHHRDIDFMSSEVLEQWLGSDDDCLGHQPRDYHCAAAAWADERSPSPGNDLSGGQPPAPAAAPKRPGRKPRARTGGPALTHVEAEKQRRDKLNRRFCELRAAVPTVSRMDRASLLADAATYIAQLRDRVEQLEAEAKHAATAAAASVSFTVAATATHSSGVQADALEVRMLDDGQEAALRLTSAARHTPARFMLALRSLDLPVRHACVCRVGGVTVHDAVVDVPAAAALRHERGLRAALLRELQRSG